MDVRTIRTQRLLEKLVCNTISEKVDVLGIQEHRMLHTEDIKYETVKNTDYIVSVAKRQWSCYWRSWDSLKLKIEKSTT